MLKQFFSIMARYLKPYRKYLVWSVVLNFFSQWMNVFSFVVLIPILNILFKIDQTVYTYQPMDWGHINKDVLINNGYAWVQELITEHGAFITLVIMGIALIIGMDCNGRIAQHGLRPCRRDLDIASFLPCDGITDMPEMPLLVYMLYLGIGNGCLADRAPVDDAGTLIDITLFVKL